MEAQNMRKLRLRQACLVVLDAALFAGTAVLALLLRYEFSLTQLMGDPYLYNVFKLLPLSIPVAIAIFAALRLYNSLWEYAGETEMLRVLGAAVCASVSHNLLLFLFELRVPRSMVLLQSVLLILCLAITRFSYRYFRKMRDARRRAGGRQARTMVIGAGAAAAMVVRELQRSEFSKNRVVCLVDDDPVKVGRNMYGVNVAGKTADIVALTRKYRVEEIVLAIPSLSALRRGEILDLCSRTECRLRTLPGIYQLVNGEVNIHEIRDVQIEDLLARDEVHLSNHGARAYYAGKTVLVTGGGGSIGSELCRQLVKCGPRKLVILDIYENNAYDIQQELASRSGGEPEICVEIGSVRDRERLEAVFAAHRPQVVFHAAAHKHVPLMEHSSCEAVKNNVFGTQNTADMAEKYGADKFILISTDKAVNPTNIMGATKRLCEMVVQSRRDSATCFAAVRFGNVLGSNGSVIPLFSRQIAAGGPVTVTDKRIIRYFMTIPEAAQLVMEAGAMAREGELFVLDMGKPVRIYDLAVNMIKLSGLRPGEDIQIREIGLRPGEKLYEELLIRTEDLDKTDNDLIFIERDAPLSRGEVEDKLAALSRALRESAGGVDRERIRMAVKQAVPTFREPEEINRSAESAREMQAVK